MSDYKHILTELYTRYNPQKVADVDQLLAKYAGREREIVLKIYMKYGGATARKDAIRKFMELELESGREVNTAPVLRQEADNHPVAQKRSWPWKKVTLLLIAALLASGLSYAGWYLAHTWPPSQEKIDAALLDAPETGSIFVLANAVLARPTCTEKPVNGENNMLHYGDQLNRYWRIDNCIQQRIDTIEGQAVRALYYPSKYFASEATFREIDGIFGNDEARQQIEHSYEKRALRKYFRSQGITGQLDQEWREAIAGKGKFPAVWQVFAKQEPAQWNSWMRGLFFPHYDGKATTHPKDFTCIIEGKNPETDRKLLAFSFDDAGNVIEEHALDLTAYPSHLLRSFPQEGEDFSRFFQENASFYAGTQQIILEDPEGLKQDFLVLINQNGIRLQHEVPGDTIRLPGMRPFIL